MKPVSTGDQNCSPFWDTWTKIQALQKFDIPVTQVVHDTDIAFTNRGVKGTSGNEYSFTWMHSNPDGSSSYSATMSYYQFLGRYRAFPLHDISEYLGIKPRAVAKKMDISVEQLYRDITRYDKLAIVGPGQKNDSFRVSSGLDLGECIDEFFGMMEAIQDNLCDISVDEEQQERARDIMSCWKEDVANIYSVNKYSVSITQLYKQWLSKKFLSLPIENSYEQFYLSEDNKENFSLILGFLENYNLFGELYNQAIIESESEISPLDIKGGELPFYTVSTVDGVTVRKDSLFIKDNFIYCEGVKVHVGENSWAALLELGNLSNLDCIIGKAIPLAVQIRTPGSGSVLAMNNMSAEYTDVALRYSSLLASNGVYPQIHGTCLVYLNMFKTIGSSDVKFRLPSYLHRFFGQEIISGHDFYKSYKKVIAQANHNLVQVKKNPECREFLMKEAFPQESAALDSLVNSKKTQGIALSRMRKSSNEYIEALEILKEIDTDIKKMQKDMISLQLQLIVDSWHAAGIEYWNNRGSIELWAYTIGGEEFYRKVVDGATISMDFLGENVYANLH